MARLAGGDREALGPLMERHHRRLYRIALRLPARHRRGPGRRPGDVREGLQGRVALGRLVGCRALAVAHRREPRHRPLSARQARRATETPLEEGDHDQRLAATAPSPERAAVGKDLGERIAAALRGLPEKQRAVFVLRHYEDMNLEDIARTLDLRLGTVKSTLHRAIQGLRVRLAGCRERDVDPLVASAPFDAARGRGAHRPRTRRDAGPRGGLHALRGRACRPARVPGPPRSRSRPRQVAEARPAIDAADMLAEVQRRIDRGTSRPEPAPAAAWPWGFALPALATAFALAALAGPPLLSRWKGETAPLAEIAAPTVSDEALDRLERTLTREHAARYLSEAQDVLVTVAASPRDCDRTSGGWTSRTRRAAAASCWPAGRCWASRRTGGQRAPRAGGRGQVLREVAALEDCVRRGDLERSSGRRSRGAGSS